MITTLSKHHFATQDIWKSSKLQRSKWNTVHR